MRDECLPFAGAPHEVADSAAIDYVVYADEAEDSVAINYLVELDTVAGTKRMGFARNIGGQTRVAHLLLMLADVSDLDVRIETTS